MANAVETISRGKKLKKTNFVNSVSNLSFDDDVEPDVDGRTVVQAIGATSKSKSTKKMNKSNATNNSRSPSLRPPPPVPAKLLQTASRSIFAEPSHSPEVTRICSPIRKKFNKSYSTIDSTSPSIRLSPPVPTKLLQTTSESIFAEPNHSPEALIRTYSPCQLTPQTTTPATATKSTKGACIIASALIVNFCVMDESHLSQ